MLKDRLPWRFRSLTNFLNENSNFIFRGVRKTPPISCNANAQVGLASLVCHRDVNIFLLACKSFLRFHNDVAVVVHSDGTLTNADVALLRQHLPGVRIISRAEADERIETEVQSEQLKSIRATDVSFLKLIDVNLFRQGKTILVDSDILFLRRPSEVIHWIQHGDSPAFHHASAELNKRVKDHLGSINSSLKLSIDTMDYSSGFIGFTESLALPRIDLVTRTLVNTAGEGWGLEQCAYAFLLTPLSVELPRRRYLIAMTNPSDEQVTEAVMIHFAGKLKHRQYYQLGIKVIQELLAPAAT